MKLKQKFKRLNEENIDIRECWPFNYLSNPNIFKYSNIKWDKDAIDDVNGDGGAPWWKRVDFDGFYLSGTLVCNKDRSIDCIEVHNLNIYTTGSDYDMSGFKSKNAKLLKEELNSLQVIITGDI